MNKLLTPERQETDRHDWSTHEEGPSRTAPTLGLADLLMVLSRRKYLLLGTIGIVTLLGIVNVYMLTPLFTATTSVMVDPREQRVINVESLVAGVPVDQSTIESEIQVVQSDELAVRVIRQLGLDRLAEFNPKVAAEQEADSFKLPSLRDLPPVQWLKSLFSDGEEEVPDPAAEEARLQTAIQGQVPEPPECFQRGPVARPDHQLHVRRSRHRLQRGEHHRQPLHHPAARAEVRRAPEGQRMAGRAADPSARGSGDGGAGGRNRARQPGRRPGPRRRAGQRAAHPAQHPARHGARREQHVPGAAPQRRERRGGARHPRRVRRDRQHAGQRAARPGNDAAPARSRTAQQSRPPPSAGRRSEVADQLGQQRDQQRGQQPAAGAPQPGRRHPAAGRLARAVDEQARAGSPPASTSPTSRSGRSSARPTPTGRCSRTSWRARRKPSRSIWSSPTPGSSPPPTRRSARPSRRSPCSSRWP